MEPAVRHPPPRTVEGFLAWVEPQRERYEFVRGRPVMMAGGSEAHNDIQVNLLAALKARLRGTGCKPNGPDLLVRIDDRTGRFPDASITCGREGGHQVTAPVAVFEILSPSSEAEARGPKRREYQSLPSLQHYALIARDAVRVELFTRTERGWLFQEFEGPGVRGQVLRSSTTRCMDASSQRRSSWIRPSAIRRCTPSTTSSPGWRCSGSATSSCAAAW